MTDKEKIKAEIENRMYAYNQEADIASAEDTINEKIFDAKYKLCKEILSFIDSLPEKSKNNPVLYHILNVAIGLIIGFCTSLIVYTHYFN